MFIREKIKQTSEAETLLAAHVTQDTYSTQDHVMLHMLLPLSAFSVMNRKHAVGYKHSKIQIFSSQIQRRLKSKQQIQKHHHINTNAHRETNTSSLPLLSHDIFTYTVFSNTDKNTQKHERHSHCDL